MKGLYAVLGLLATVLVAGGCLVIWAPMDPFTKLALIGGTAIAFGLILFFGIFWLITTDNGVTIETVDDRFGGTG